LTAYTVVPIVAFTKINSAQQLLKDFSVLLHKFLFTDVVTCWF